MRGKSKKVELPIGTHVRMVNCSEAEIYGDRIWETRSELWECCGAMIVSLKGRAGGFDVARLEVVSQ